MNRKERRRLKKQGVRVAAADTPSILRQAALHHRLGRFADAEVLYRRALAGDPNNPDALHLLGLTRREQGAAGEAVELIRRAIDACGGGNALYFKSLAATLLVADQPADAEAAARRALEFEADFAEALAVLGSALRALGRRDEAETTLRRAIDLEADKPDAWTALGNVQVARGDEAAAVETFRAALERAPTDEVAVTNLAGALRRLDRTAEAETVLRAGIEARPNSARLYDTLALVMLEDGQVDEAADTYAKALDADPGDPEALAMLAGSGRCADDPALLRRIEHRLETGAEGADAIKLRFALADALRDQGDTNRAFRRYAEANAARRGELVARGHGFDAEEHDAFVSRIVEVFDRAFIADRSEAGLPSEVPVFVVGMPRSGTTLVEHIAASHPDVHGAGELTAFAGLREGLAAAVGAPEGEAFPECTRRLDANAARQVAEAHLARLADIGGGAARVIDKSPLNVFTMGLAAVLFPNASIVHCRRDARDIGLSCFMTNFVAPFAWATDLGDIGRYHRAFETLMAHWRATVPNPVLEMVYEDLVADAEGQSRRLIDFLGLAWDDRCLSAHDSRRTVRTASLWQVRRPIGVDAVGRWHTYADELAPLEAGLEGR